MLPSENSEKAYATSMFSKESMCWGGGVRKKCYTPHKVHYKS